MSDFSEVAKAVESGKPFRATPAGDIWEMTVGRGRRRFELTNEEFAKLVVERQRGAGGETTE